MTPGAQCAFPYLKRMRRLLKKAEQGCLAHPAPHCKREYPSKQPYRATSRTPPASASFRSHTSATEVAWRTAFLIAAGSAPLTLSSRSRCASARAVSAVHGTQIGAFQKNYLAKVGVEGSSPSARPSSFPKHAGSKHAVDKGSPLERAVSFSGKCSRPA
jgi:hypothetical protein